MKEREIMGSKAEKEQLTIASFADKQDKMSLEDRENLMPQADKEDKRSNASSPHPAVLDEILKAVSTATIVLNLVTQDLEAQNGYKIRKYQGMAESLLKRLPYSILDFGRNQILYAIVQDNDKPIAHETNRKNEGNKYNYSELKFSEFSPDAVKFFYKFFLSDYPEAKIFDPFAGRGTRGIVAYTMGFNYYGVDIMPETIESNKQRFLSIQRSNQKLTEFYEDCDIRWNLGDSCDTHIIDNIAPESFDFALTCPPYWNTEVYSDLVADLSTSPSYEVFLHRIAIAYKNTYKVLKHNTFFVFVANYFRREGQLYHLARDLVRLGEEAGFKHYDEIVLKLNSQRALRTMSSAFHRYFSAKNHEYVEVLYKP